MRQRQQQHPLTYSQPGNTLDKPTVNHKGTSVTLVETDQEHALSELAGQETIAVTGADYSGTINVNHDLDHQEPYAVTVEIMHTLEATTW